MRKLIALLLAMVFFVPIAMASEKADLLVVDFGLKWTGSERSGMQMLMEKGKPAKAIWDHKDGGGSRPEKGEFRITIEDVFVAKNGMPAVKLQVAIVENRSGEIVELGSVTPSLILGRSGILNLEQPGKKSIELDINVRHASPEEIEGAKGKSASCDAPPEDQSKNGGCCYVDGPPCTGVWQCCGALSCCCGSRCCHPQ